MTKTKQTNKNQTKQNNGKKAEPICTRAVTIGDSSFANLDSKTLLRMTARERVREKSCSRDVIQGYSFDQSFTKAGKLKLIEGIRFY